MSQISEMTQKEKKDWDRLSLLDSSFYTNKDRARLTYLYSKHRRLQIHKANFLLPEKHKIFIQLAACIKCEPIDKQIVRSNEPFRYLDGSEQLYPPFQKGCYCQIRPYRKAWQSIFDDFEKELEMQNE